MAPNYSTLKPLSAGDVIIDTKPILHIIYKQFKGKYCDNCLMKSDSLKICSKCHQMSYCDKNCQTIDWKYHKNECKFFAKKEVMFDSMNWSQRLLIRLWLTIKTNKEFVSKPYKMFDGSDLSLNDIKVEEEAVITDEERMTKFRMICSHFQLYGIDFNVKQLFHWFGLITTKVICNDVKYYFESYSVEAYKDPEIGVGLYPELYGVTHSCAPNSVVVTNGLSLQMRAIETIAVGTDITRNFVDKPFKKNDRKMVLQKTFLINDCKCIKCEQNLDSNIDYEKLKSLCDALPDTHSFFQFIKLKESSSALSEIVTIFREALGEWSPYLTWYLIQNHINRRIIGSTIGFQNTIDNQRVEEHIRIVYGVNHPIYKMTLKFLQ